MEKDKNEEAITIRVPAWMKNGLEEIARMHKVSASNVGRWAIEEYLTGKAIPDRFSNKSSSSSYPAPRAEFNEVQESPKAAAPAPAKKKKAA